MKDFTKFTGECHCLNLFINKVAGLRPDTWFFIDTPAQVFSCEFYEMFKNIYTDFYGLLRNILTSFKIFVLKEATTERLKKRLEITISFYKNEYVPVIT